jgi:2',3'-cyclic-nucleotide 2'-phosphodiesterase (5'-nucleotidase family)
MALKNSCLLFAALVFTLSGCTTVQHISKTNVRYESISSKSSLAPDEEITALLAPYKEKLDAQMNEVVGTVAKEMTKKKPESTLGNWFADGMLAGAEKAGFKADLAVSNYGGLRLPYLAAGPLTRGELFELCPFDNMLVIVDVPGVLLDSLLLQIAEADGWPVSKGVRMIIQNKSLQSCTIHGTAVMPEKIYKVAMPDYVANGGDGLKMLIPLERVQTGRLVRDILIAYAEESTRNGQPISASIEGRIVQQ